MGKISEIASSEFSGLLAHPDDFDTHLLSKIPDLTKGHVQKLPTGEGVLFKQGNYSYIEGAECVNPSGNKDIYRKVFRNAEIYLQNEREQAYFESMGITPENNFSRRQIILSMVGYSDLNPQKSPELGGMTTKEYEAIATRLYNAIIPDIRHHFSQLEIVSIDGASDFGIDKPLVQTRFDDPNMRGLSFSCPEYLIYVQDRINRVFVADDAQSYFTQFAALTDIMGVLGGRDAAFWKNYLVSKHHYPLRRKFAPVADPIATFTGKLDLPYFRDGNPFEQSSIANASKAIMTELGIPPDPDIDSLVKRITSEIRQFIQRSPVYADYL